MQPIWQLNVTPSMNGNEKPAANLRGLWLCTRTSGLWKWWHYLSRISWSPWNAFHSGHFALGWPMKEDVFVRSCGEIFPCYTWQRKISTLNDPKEWKCLCSITSRFESVVGQGNYPRSHNYTTFGRCDFSNPAKLFVCFFLGLGSNTGILENEPNSWIWRLNLCLVPINLPLHRFIDSFPSTS